MNLILHMLKKDTLRLKVLLILWAALILLQSIMGGMKAAAVSGDTGWQIILTYAQYLVPILQTITLVVMVPLLIHEEPLTGNTAFWFTRPISGRMLLREKSFFILSFLVAVPLLTEVAVMAANGITLRHILLAVPEIILEQLGLIIAVAFVAVITPNFAKFSQVVMAGFVGLILLQYLLMINLLGKDGLNSYFSNEFLTESRALASGILTILFGTFLIHHQYLTRRTRKTVLYALPCLLIVLAAQYFWPWNFLEPKPETVSKSVLNTDNISLSFNTDSVYASDKAQWNSKSEPKKEVSGGIEVDGEETRDFILPLKTEAVLAFPDGKSFNYNTSEFEEMYSGRGENDGTAIQSALNPVDLVNKRDYHSFSLFEIEDKFYQQYLNTPGTYTGKVTLRLSRYQVEGELPLERGARFKRGSEYVVITDVLRQPHGVNILMRDQTVNLLFDRNRKKSGRSFSPGKNDVVYVLQNKKLRQAFMPANDFDFSMDNILGGNTRLLTHPFRLQYTGVNDRWGTRELPDINEKWLKDAVLVRLRLLEMGTFTKPLVVKDFQFSHNRDQAKTDKEKDFENKDREADALVSLANVYSDTARYAEAEPLYNTATTMRAKYNGPESPELVSCYQYHACMYDKEKKYAKALALNEQILAIKEKNGKVTDPEWDALYKGLSELAEKNQDFAKAENYLKRGGEVCTQKFGDKDVRTVKLTESLNEFYKKHPKR